jgi:hypothetical protein
MNAPFSDGAPPRRPIDLLAEVSYCGIQPW